MNLEIIKSFIKEYKKYCLFGILLILGIFIYYCTSQKTEVDNSNLLTQSSQSSATINKDAGNKNSSSAALSTSSNSSTTTKVTCDISGAVKHGGVYTLKAGARLIDLIEVAGGLTEKAQIKAINRAQLLKDQDQIYIPHQGEKIEQVATGSTNNAQASSGNSVQESNKEQIHLNSATVADLQKLNGIGQKRAEQIIQFRDANGGFKQIQDITKVSGIGDKTFEKFKDQLAL